MSNIDHLTNKADPTSLERNHKPRIFFSPSLVLKSYMCPEVYFETCFIFVYFRKYTSRHMLGGKKSSISEIPEVLSTRPLQKITGGTLSLRSVRMFTHGKKTQLTCRLDVYFSTNQEFLCCLDVLKSCVFLQNVKFLS